MSSKTVKSVTRCVKLHNQMEEIDARLKSSYNYRRRIKEEKIFKKAEYIKSFGSKKVKIGLFLKNGKLLEGLVCDVLNRQYA